MKVAILGAGAVGGTLAKGWATAGHDVVLAVRDPAAEKVRALGLPAAPVAEAVRGAEVVLLATPWPATQAALAAAGDLAGKVLIDATNPLKADFSGLDVAPGGSGADKVAAWAPGARVVKAFNQTGWEAMADPRYPAGPAVMFLAGDDAAAKERASTLVADLGFETVDAGPLAAAPLLENLAMLWIHLMARRGLGRGWAFGILRR